MCFKIFQEDAEGFRLYQGSFDGLTWSFNELQDISRGFREASGGCRAFFWGFKVLYKSFVVGCLEVWDKLLGNSWWFT